MARKKQYIEEEVIQKAMNLFWKNGYETTSMQMLEKEMGINKFSIYASFGSKNGVFLASLKCYKEKLKVITEKLKNSNNGITGIQEYFYDFLDFSKENDLRKGCLVTNTANELNEDSDKDIREQLFIFTNYIKSLFHKNLVQENRLSDTKLEELSDYLIVSMYGLASASRVFNKVQLDIYIKNIFNNI